MDAVEVESRERVQIRTRENGSTLAAWRVSLRVPQGAIVLAESGGKAWLPRRGRSARNVPGALAELWKAALASGHSEPSCRSTGEARLISGPRR